MPLLRLVTAVTLGLNVLGTILILALSALINADVIGRSAFDAPINGVTEFAALALVAIVFLQIGAATTADKLTRSDVVPNALAKRSPRAAAALTGLFDLLALAFFLALTLATVAPSTRAFITGDYVGVAGIVTFPTWPVRAIILLSAALMTLTFLIRVAGAVRVVFAAVEPGK